MKRITSHDFIICAIIVGLKGVLVHTLERSIADLWGDDLVIEVKKMGPSLSKGVEDRGVFTRPTTWPSDAYVYVRLQRYSRASRWHPVEGGVLHPALKQPFRFICGFGGGHGNVFQIMPRGGDDAMMMRIRNVR